MRALAGLAAAPLLSGCLLVPPERVRDVLDPDGDGWLTDLDCDNADPTRGGAERHDNAIDDDCDGLAVFDVRYWPIDDSRCWERGEAGGLLLLGGGEVRDASGDRQADAAMLTEDLDGDGLPETLRVVGAALHWEPTSGEGALSVALERPPARVRWGGVVQACPTALVIEPDPVQPAWHGARRVSLCDGAALAGWTWSGGARAASAVDALPLGADRWPDLVVARGDRDVPDVAIRILDPASSGGHDAFDLRIIGPGGPFGARVSVGDFDGDRGRDLAILGDGGVWLIRGEQLPARDAQASAIDVRTTGRFVEVDGALDVAFHALGGGSAQIALVAAPGEGGPRLYGYDADGAQVAFGAAPDGSCGPDVALDDGVIVVGGRAWGLP